MTINLVGFNGASLSLDPKLLPEVVGVSSFDMRPGGKGDARPWNAPSAVGGVTLGAGRKTIYRMGSDVESDSSYWLSWTTVVHAIRGFDATDTTERTYYTGSGTPKWVDNTNALSSAPYPSATRELSAPQPTVAPTATLTTDGPSGTAAARYWVYTWVNDIGWESAPSPASNSLTIKPGAVVGLVPNGTPPAGNYSITKIRWYATQTASDGTVEFAFLREYTLGASGQADDGRALGETLATESWIPLDGTAANLTACWSQFAAATVGKAVRFCEPGYLYAWPLAYEYVVTHTPVAMAAFSQRLVCLTTGGAEVFTGTDPGSMDQKPIDLPACVSQRSVCSSDAGVFYASNDGIQYYGVDGWRNLTAGVIRPDEFKTLFNPSSARAVLWKGLYICWLDSNGAGVGGLVVDPSNAQGVFFLSTAYAAGYVDPLTRSLYVVDSTTLKKWDAGSAHTWTWRSKVFRQARTEEFDRFELVCGGATTVKVWVDGTLFMNRSVTAGEHRLPNGIKGRDWQFELSSTSPVQAMSVYYG